MAAGWIKGARGTEAEAMARGALDLAKRHGMRVMAIDAMELLGLETASARQEAGYQGPGRP